MALTDTIRHPVGPLPLWGWLVVGVGGVFVFKIVRGSGSSSSSGTSSPVATGSPITDTGVGGQTIQNTSINPVNQPVLDKLTGYASGIRGYKDAIASLSATIKKLQAIPANRRTAAQKKLLASDLAKLNADKTALAKVQAELAAYEQGLITGSNGTTTVPAVSTAANTVQLTAPALSANPTERIVGVQGLASTPPTITSLQSRTTGGTHTIVPAPSLGR